MQRFVLAVAVSAFLVAKAFPVGAQPSPQTLLRDIRHDEDAVPPAFVTLTAAQVKAQTTAGLLEIDDGVMIVQAIEIELPKGDNSQYAMVEFEPPVVHDARGTVVAIEPQNGSLNPTRNSIEHRLLQPGGEAAAAFKQVRGRVTVRIPLRVETRTIRSGDRESLGKAGAVIDGPFVRYRRELVAEGQWRSELRPVRAYDAQGKALEHEGTYPDRVNGEGFEAVAFHGSPATVELDLPQELTTVVLDYELTLGDRKATKITKTLGAASAPAAVAAAPTSLDAADALAQLKRLNYPAIDGEQFVAAAANGEAKAVSLFLGAGLSPDTKAPSGMTALHVAAQLGHSEVVDLLLTAGANVNAKDANGLTPLFGLTPRCDQSATVAKLIAKGADVNAKGNSPVSPLMLAKSMNCTAIVEALTKAGAR